MYTYIYHLSDVTCHNHAFTATAVDNILSLQPPTDIAGFKSANCSTQYKSKCVFYFWQSLAKHLGKKCLMYYGVSGHGKGLVDNMSAFEVKNFLRKAVLTDNFSYNKASDIYNYFIKHFEQDPQKKYFLLESETIYEKQSQKKTYYIKNCRSRHMICFHPDGSVQTKQNTCSCHNCIQGGVHHMH